MFRWVVVRLNKRERADLDRRVSQLFKAKGTLCVNQISKHFQIKWETAYNSVKRLVRKGDIYYHPEMGDNPSFYSIWPDKAAPRYFSDTQIPQERESERDLTITTSVSDPLSSGIVRGDPVQIIEERGFVCYPSTKGKDVPRTFIRAHLHGQYFVDVLTVGKMHETFIIPGSGIKGGWISRMMNGNRCYYGHIIIPSDPKPFNIHAMSSKDGSIKGLSVYVHPRYIYYKDNSTTASIEFRQQVVDVTDVLKVHGWEFGAIVQKGTYSMAINDPMLASHVPTNHVETLMDAVHYDSSVKDADGVCTEAEILLTEPSDEEKSDLMVELPTRFIGLETRVSALGKTMAGMVDVMERAIPHMETLTKTVSDLATVTEFNSSVIFGTANPLGRPDQGYIAKDTKEDRMYG